LILGYKVYHHSQIFQNHAYILIQIQIHQVFECLTDNLIDHYKEQYLEGIKKVLSEGNPKQLDTLPLVLPESKQSFD
jgi:hypothetical protein